jgi:peptidyl-prolyl cis-trans isomerase B (cyclophilin B)
MVKLHTNLGTITLDLDAASPGVENFLAYVNSGFYANTVFHRVIDGFMIRGRFEPGLKEKPTDSSIKNGAENGLKNQAYTIAMARTPDPRPPASFYQQRTTTSWFGRPEEFGYCVFGRVVEGKGVVDQIRKFRLPRAECITTCQ